MAVAFDEMNGPEGDLRPAYQELSRWLKETPPDALEYRRQEAELLFRRIGITFAVYGDAEAQERLIPFDVIPRILSGKEWTILEKGLKQRVRALNMFLRDIYHERTQFDFIGRGWLWALLSGAVITVVDWRHRPPSPLWSCDT